RDTPHRGSRRVEPVAVAPCAASSRARDRRDRADMLAWLPRADHMTILRRVRERQTIAAVQRVVIRRRAAARATDPAAPALDRPLLAIGAPRHAVAARHEPVEVPLLALRDREVALAQIDRAHRLHVAAASSGGERDLGIVVLDLAIAADLVRAARRRCAE